MSFEFEEAPRSNNVERSTLSEQVTRMRERDQSGQRPQQTTESSPSTAASHLPNLRIEGADKSGNKSTRTQEQPTTRTEAPRQQPPEKMPWQHQQQEAQRRQQEQEWQARQQWETQQRERQSRDMERAERGRVEIQQTNPTGTGQPRGT
ncbi:MAG: hypothetical protein HY711_11340 [Candidatus Melainabacteria bacterium]|nr:hypothetical protein [Candidatus Melainabacteria bacterium]